MYKKLTLIVAAVFLSVSAAYAERIELGGTTEDVKVTVTESNDLRTIVRFDVGAFYQNPVTIDNETYYTLSTGKEAVLLNKGEPSLPRVCRSIIIPDNARMGIKIVSSEYIDFPNTPIAPSKGNLLRTVNPEDVPYTFGDVYGENAWYPGPVADIREPYILRDYRGTVIEFNAFQYNPATRTLRVYTSVTVEVLNVGPGEINVLARNKRAQALDPDFDLIYQRRFINYDFQLDKYAPVVERGDMLIITYDAFHTAMEPFVAWKERR